jgi:hypothetical protein
MESTIYFRISDVGCQLESMLHYGNTYIKPTNEYHFHLWLPDIAMQFNYLNKPCLILTNLYCLNNQSLKEKYNINKNSATRCNAGNDYHFGEYSNFDAWKERWGWHYENVHEYFELINKLR